jgi:ppGpp synthetase/RelA/SpoT-type nucleotidyltranferase
MTSDPADLILKEYDAQRSLYEAFAPRVRQIIRELPDIELIKILDIYARVKERDSLEAKVRKSLGRYTKLDDITDIAGVRVVTFFEDDVARIAKVIADIFDVQSEHSEDKSTTLGIDRFGYHSVHIVARLDKSRLALREFARFAPCTVEIQVCSILQHAWAEIEHKLGYKGAFSLPDDIKRKFNVLSGVLELSDAEFIRIREAIEFTRREIETKTLQGAPLEINGISIRYFIDGNYVLKRIESNVDTITRTVRRDGARFPDVLANGLVQCGYENTYEIERSLLEHERILTAIGVDIATVGPDSMIKGESLMYLCYIAGRSLGEDRLRSVYEALNMSVEAARGFAGIMEITLASLTPPPTSEIDTEA